MEGRQEQGTMKNSSLLFEALVSLLDFSSQGTED